MCFFGRFVGDCACVGFVDDAVRTLPGTLVKDGVQRADVAFLAPLSLMWTDLLAPDTRLSMPDRKTQPVAGVFYSVPSQVCFGSKEEVHENYIQTEKTGVQVRAGVVSCSVSVDRVVQ